MIMNWTRSNDFPNYTSVVGPLTKFCLLLWYLFLLPSCSGDTMKYTHPFSESCSKRSDSLDPMELTPRSEIRQQVNSNENNHIILSAMKEIDRGLRWAGTRCIMRL